MSAVSETIVREYFELHGFLVRQQRKFVPSGRPEDDAVDFHVINPRFARPSGSLPFVLGSSELPAIARGVVLVKGWHTDTFTPGLLAHAPEIFRSLEPNSFKEAVEQLGGGGPVTRMLVLPALPTGDEAREQSIGMLLAKGVDAVIPFRTMLADLIDQTEVNRNYQKSDLLQMLRILKNYEFFREPQMDLFSKRRTRRR